MLDCAEVLLKTMFSGLRKAYTVSTASASPEASIVAVPVSIFRNLRSAEITLLPTHFHTLQNWLPAY
jgi:hypothetical protein